MAIPVVSVSEMQAIDTASEVDELELINRAGSAVADIAIEMLQSSNGHSVLVVVGPGNNGQDGMVAAQALQLKGYEITIVPVADLTSEIPNVDLVIDAAFGTGFRGEFIAPDVKDAQVLCVDVPSGLNAETGAPHGAPFTATKTLTLGAVKTGLLFGSGPEYVGELLFSDIGLKAENAPAKLLTIDDVLEWLPSRQRNANKWSAAACIVAGSPGMQGAADLCANGAYRSGAGMVRLCVPGVDYPWSAVTEAVVKSFPTYDSVAIMQETQRCHAVAVGPGLGRNSEVDQIVRDIIMRCPLPIVIDGDGISALGSPKEAVELLKPRVAPTVLTPHDGEFARLNGEPAGLDRIEDACRLARNLNSFVLLKGPTTIIAAPFGEVFLSNSGDERLATAGVGDVLTGIIVALLAQGMPPFEAAATGAFIHGHASEMGYRHGFVASDLPALIPQWFESHIL